MPGKIPHEFIDHLLSRVDIVDIINAQVPLKKTGHDYMARCPFHAEKTPSFTVSHNKQFFHCFGCGAHGSAIGFLMDYAHLSFYEAVEDLAARVGMELPRESINNPHDQASDLEPNYKILAQASAWFRQQLRIHPQASQAITYLKGRGLTGEIAAEYGLGYAPPGWDGLLNTLGVDANAVQRLVQNGLVVEQHHHHHDRFRERIMFPIRDRRGRTIGFGGRVLGDEKPKYLNSPETPLFHKGKELYGLFEARRALRHIEQVLVVEGYMDVIALAQFGIRYVVATLGTATTALHLEQLFKICNRLVFCFDGDKAGREAAWKAATMALPMAGGEHEIRFIFLPEGEDPDTSVRSAGAAVFEQKLTGAKHLSEVIFAHLGANLDLNSLDGKAKLAEQVRPLLSQIPAGIYRDMLTVRLEQLTGLPIASLGIQQASRNRSALPHIAQDTAPLALVQRATALLIQYPQVGVVVAQISPNWRHLRQPDTTVLAAVVDVLQIQPTLSTAALIERWRDSTLFVELKRLAQYNLGGGNANPQAEFVGSMHRLNTLVQNQETPILHSSTLPSELTNAVREQLKRSVVRAKPPNTTANTF